MMETLKADVKEYILTDLKDRIEYQKHSKIAYEKAKISHVLIGYAIDDMPEASELHNEVLNNNYFIIGTYKAKQWLGDFIFEAIEKIKEYEEENFGEIYTDLSCPEKIANMLAYILGEEILHNCPVINFRWNSRLTPYSLELLISLLDLQQ